MKSTERAETSPVNKVYEYQGKEYNLHQLCNVLGFKYISVWRKLQQGKTIEQAVKECSQNPRSWLGMKV